MGTIGDTAHPESSNVIDDDASAPRWTDMRPTDDDDLTATNLVRHGPTRRGVVVAVALFAVPVVVYFALGVRAVEPINGQDGYLYAGIAARLTDFLSRFPDEYYGVRFGHILPTWGFRKVFGLEFGHLIWRFGLLGLICVVLRARGLLRAPQAFVAAAIFCTSPIVLVSTFSTYTLSTGVPALVAGALILATTDDSDRHSFARIACAGALLALSWNSNIVALPLCGVIACVFVVDRLHTQDRSVARIALHDLLPIAFGTLAVVVPGALVYGLRFDIPNIYGPTIEQARLPTADAFLEPGWRWISWRPYLLIGPLSLVLTAVAWRSETTPGLRTIARRLTLLVAASSLLFILFQWVFGTPLLALYFYSALPLALCVASIGFAAAVIIGRSSTTTSTPLTIGAGFLSIGATTLGARIDVRFAVLLVLCVVATGIAVATMLGRRSMPLGAILMLIVASWAVVAAPHDFPPTPGGYRTDPWYDDVLLAFDDTSMDRIKIMDEMARMLPSLPADRGEIAVWFDSRGPYDQLTAPFLWFKSSLQSGADGPVPEVTYTVRYRLAMNRPRFVVIIDGDDLDAEAGMREVMARGPYSLVWSQRLSSGQSSARIILLERAAGTWRDFPCRHPRTNEVGWCT